MSSWSLAAILFIPLVFAWRPQEEREGEEPLPPPLRNGEAAATPIAQADANNAHIEVNPRSFALVDIDVDNTVLFNLDAYKTVHSKVFAAEIKSSDGGKPGPRGDWEGGSDAAHVGHARQEGVQIKNKFLDFLFNLIDVDHGGGITQKEWDDHVTGPWKPLLYEVLNDAHDSQGITKKSFNMNWERAVDRAFHQLGGGEDSKITSENVQKLWADAANWEKQFVKDHFMTNGHISGAEFEEFLYTAMVFRCMDENSDGGVQWEELSGNPTALAAFGGAGVGEKFTAYFGQDSEGVGEMKLGKLYQLLNENNVFIPVNNYG